MSVSFDRVAHIYDATRGFPPHISEQVTDCIIHLVAATPETKFLEPGIGTGRLALPIVQQGYNYTGVDISKKMLNELQRKLGSNSHSLTLIETDATALPFDDNSFDVALTAHVLHLIPTWREVLAELRRVLKPEGVYLYCSNVKSIARKAFEQEWKTILARYNIELVSYGAASKEEVMQVLQEQEAELETVTAAKWESNYKVGELVASYAERVYSNSWQIPDAVFPAMVEDLRAWARATYQSDDTILPSEDRFEITVVRNWAQG